MYTKSTMRLKIDRHTFRQTIWTLDIQYRAVTIRVMAEMSFPGPFNLILLIAPATTYEREKSLMMSTVT